MPVKKDAQQHWVEMEFLADGTPEQLWQAMATGPGNSAWFTLASIEERVGGVLRFEFGPGMASTGEVTAWEPPLRFGYVEREWSEGAPPVATEITIQARGGGHCVVRMVHSLFTSRDDWDDQLESFESGWPGFFAVLRLYVAHFAGQSASSFQVMTGFEGEPLEAWQRLTAALRLAGADVGSEREFGPVGLAASGIVEINEQNRRTRLLIVRSAQGLLIAGVYATKPGRAHVSVSLYSYGPDAAARSTSMEPAWRQWLSEAFPTPAG